MSKKLAVVTYLLCSILSPQNEGKIERKEGRPWKFFLS